MQQQENVLYNASQRKRSLSNIFLRPSAVNESDNCDLIQNFQQQSQSQTSSQQSLTSQQSINLKKANYLKVSYEKSISSGLVKRSQEFFQDKPVIFRKGSQVLISLSKVQERRERRQSEHALCYKQSEANRKAIPIVFPQQILSKSITNNQLKVGQHIKSKIQQSNLQNRAIIEQIKTQKQNKVISHQKLVDQLKIGTKLENQSNINKQSIFSDSMVQPHLTNKPLAQQKQPNKLKNKINDFIAKSQINQKQKQEIQPKSIKQTIQINQGQEQKTQIYKKQEQEQKCQINKKHEQERQLKSFNQASQIKQKQGKEHKTQMNKVKEQEQKTHINKRQGQELSSQINKKQELHSNVKSKEQSIQKQELHSNVKRKEQQSQKQELYNNVKRKEQQSQINKKEEQEREVKLNKQQIKQKKNGQEESQRIKKRKFKQTKSVQQQNQNKLQSKNKVVKDKERLQIKSQRTINQNTIKDSQSYNNLNHVLLSNNLNQSQHHIHDIPPPNFIQKNQKQTLLDLKTSSQSFPPQTMYQSQFQSQQLSNGKRQLKPEKARAGLTNKGKQLGFIKTSKNDQHQIQKNGNRQSKSNKLSSFCERQDIFNQFKSNDYSQQPLLNQNQPRKGDFIPPLNRRQKLFKRKESLPQHTTRSASRVQSLLQKIQQQQPAVNVAKKARWQRDSDREQEIQTLKEQLQKLRKIINREREYNSSIKMELHQMKESTDVLILNQKILDLKNLIRVKDKELVAFKQQNSSLRRQIALLNKSISNKSKTQSNIVKLQNQISYYNQLLRQARSKNTNLQQQCMQKNTQIQQLLKRNQFLVLSNKHLKQFKTEQQNNIYRKNLKKNQLQLQKIIETQSQEIALLKQKLQNAWNQQALNRKRMIDLRTKLSIVKQNDDLLRQKIKKKDNILAKFKNSQLELQKTIRNFNLKQSAKRHQSLKSSRSHTQNYTQFQNSLNFQQQRSRPGFQFKGISGNAQWSDQTLCNNYPLKGLQVYMLRNKIVSARGVYQTQNYQVLYGSQPLFIQNKLDQYQVRHLIAQNGDFIHYISGAMSETAIVQILLVTRKRQILKVGVGGRDLKKFNFGIDEDQFPSSWCGELRACRDEVFLSRIGCKVNKI